MGFRHTKSVIVLLKHTKLPANFHHRNMFVYICICISLALDKTKIDKFHWMICFIFVCIYYRKTILRNITEKFLMPFQSHQNLYWSRFSFKIVFISCSCKEKNTSYQFKRQYTIQLRVQPNKCIQVVLIFMIYPTKETYSCGKPNHENQTGTNCTRL